MAEGLDSRFADVVVVRWGDWVRSAFCLTGSQPVAEDLVTAALVMSRRSWRRLEADGDPAGRVHAEICRLHTARLRRHFLGPPGVDPGTPPTESLALTRHQQDQVWAALRNLPAADRAAVVLTVVEGADQAQCAALLGCTARTAAARRASGIRTLHASVQPPVAPAAVEPLLVAAAAERLATLDVSTDPLPDVRAAVRGDRGRRLRVGAVVAAGCLVVLGVGVALGRGTAPPAGGSPTAPTSNRTVELAGQTWPVAGGLAADVSSMTEVEAALGQPGPWGSFSPRVVFADDLDDERVVLATDGLGHAWFLHGARGTPFRILDGYGSPTTVGAFGGPLSLLMPRPGPDADLLVLAPTTVRVQVATRPAVWPVERPPYRPLDMQDGLRLTPLDRQAPFALSASTVTVRGIDTSGPVDGVVFELPDLDPVVHDHTDTGALASRYPGQQAGTVVDAAATAVSVGAFGQEPLGLAVVATTTATACGSTRCRLTAAVVEAVAGDVRSRTLAVHSGTTGNGTPLSMAGSDTATPSDARLPDHRPRVVGFMPQLEGMPVGTMVWADSPRGRIRYVAGQGDDRRVRSARLDADGFVWLDDWTDVHVVSVRGADGLGRWHTDEP